MKPNFGIKTEHQHSHYKVVVVDTALASYQGLNWRTLGDWGKRKFENLLVLTSAPQRLKIHYV